MGMIRGTSSFFGKHLFNVRSWVGYDQLRSSTRDVTKAGKAVFRGPKIHSPETFAEALRRLNVSESDIAERYNSCRSTFYFFAVITAVLLVYGVYVFISGSLMGTILSLSVAALMGMLAFKNHFWMFQIKHRKLGCSFSEWCSGKVKK